MSNLVEREHPQNSGEIRLGLASVQKNCNISETVQDRTKVTTKGLMGSRIRVFNWYQNR